MTNKTETVTVPRELLERLEKGVKEPEVGLLMDVRKLLAAPAEDARAVAEEPVPDHFVAACDKFDWTPEEALRFYADGKHFDTVDGRTRILCTGAIASHALKGMGGEYADMKGMDSAGGEVEVLGYATRRNGKVGSWLHHSEDAAQQFDATANAGYKAFSEIVPVVDRAHVTRLEADKQTNLEYIGKLEQALNSASSERDAVKAEVEQQRKLKLILAERVNNAEANCSVYRYERDTLQSELTKAQEELRLEKIVSEAMRTQANDWRRLAWQRKNNPDAEGKYDLTLFPFLKLMERELHANAYKGDRPAWLKLSAAECLLEIYYHVGKLHKAVHGGCKVEEVTEYAADVANLSMMLTDITGALGWVVKESENASNPDAGSGD